ncbi:hypothetical protein ACIXHL_09540 [Bacteroides fragilis]
MPYWGVFSDTEYCGSENSLRSYGIFFVNTLRRVVRLPFGCGCPCRLLPRNPTLFFPFRSVGGGAVVPVFKGFFARGGRMQGLGEEYYPKHEGGDCSPNGVAARPCSRRKAPCLLRLCKRE